jgi:hypothetical protein
MKTTIMLIAAGAVVAAGTVAIVRAVRRRREFQVQTQDDLFEEPVVITEEVFVMTEEPDEPSTFTL